MSLLCTRRSFLEKANARRIYSTFWHKFKRRLEVSYGKQDPNCKFLWLVTETKAVEEYLWPLYLLLEFTVIFLSAHVHPARQIMVIKRQHTWIRSLAENSRTVSLPSSCHTVYGSKNLHVTLVWLDFDFVLANLSFKLSLIRSQQAEPLLRSGSN